MLPVTYFQSLNNKNGSNRTNKTFFFLIFYSKMNFYLVATLSISVKILAFFIILVLYSQGL